MTVAAANMARYLPEGGALASIFWATIEDGGRLMVAWDLPPVPAWRIQAIWCARISLTTHGYVADRGGRNGPKHGKIINGHGRMVGGFIFCG